jgi:uncharacterized protein YktA (UPF0223 family)
MTQSKIPTISQFFKSNPKFYENIVFNIELAEAMKAFGELVRRKTLEEALKENYIIEDNGGVVHQVIYLQSITSLIGSERLKIE